MTAVPSSAEQKFLARHGATPGARLEPLGGGANNQVFRVEIGVRSALLKRYFHSSDDTRDRFSGEQRFYSHALAAAAEFVPRPLGWDKVVRCGLFEFIDGRKLKPGEPDEAHVLRAADFTLRLNENRAARAAYPATADSAFSLRDNRLLIQKRIDRIAGIMPERGIQREAKRLASERLLPLWKIAERTLQEEEGAPHAVCGDVERVISPSDFGFHNALLEPTGRLLFLDFEYAGSDDPAKLLCDFFSQPEIPAPPALRTAFVERLLGLIPVERHSLFLRRAESLRIPFHLKWCCIMLNEFLPEGAKRRSFALRPEEVEQRQQRQLLKVQEYLARHCEA